MIQFKSFTQAPRAFLFLALLLIMTFGSSCGGAKKNSTTGSLSSVFGGGAFEGEIKAKMFAGAQPTEVRYVIKGIRTRIETQFSLPQFSPGGAQTSVMRTSVTLMDSSSTTQTTLSPETKTYTTMDFGEMAEKMAKEIGKDSSIAFPKVTSTGRTETIAGIACQHWMIGDTTDACLAKGLGSFGGGGSGGILDMLKNLAQGKKTKTQIDNPEFAKFAEDGVFPLKMSNIENGQSKTFMEVTSVERKSLDDSLFTVPADYKKTELPGIPVTKR
jgi:hypothetical protein